MQEPLAVIIRSLSLFVLVWLATRLIGKRTVSWVKPFNFVGYIVLAIVATLMSLNLVNLTSGFIVLLTWLVLPIALDYLSIKSQVIHQLLQSTANTALLHGTSHFGHKSNHQILILPILIKKLIIGLVHIIH